MLTSISADIMEKLKILSDAAKFDVAWHFQWCIPFG